MGGGSSTNWGQAGSTNWSLTSGGANGAAIPQTGDRVFFDANSGTGASTWNVSISLTGLDCTGSKNVVTQSNSQTITLTAGDLILPDGSGGSYTTGTGQFLLSATSGTQHIKANGGHLHILTLNGVGGTFQLTGDLAADVSATSSIILTNGTFDAQSFAVTTPVFNTNNANTRVIIGTGPWTITGATGNVWISNNAGTGLTTSSFTSTITFTGNFNTGRTLAFGTHTWANPVVLGANTGTAAYTLGVTTTLASLTINGPNYVVGQTSTTYNLTGALTINGTLSGLVLLQNLTNATANRVTFDCGANGTFNWCALRDIAYSTSTATATSSFDCGNNTGVTFTPPPVGVARARLHLGA